MFPCEYCEIFDETFLAEQLWVTAFDTSFGMLETDTYPIFGILMKAADFFSNTTNQLRWILYLFQAWLTAAFPMSS